MHGSSLNVYHALHDSFFTEGESEESYAICALLHDLCKANYYKLGHPQCEERSHRAVGKSALLQCRGSVSLRSRRKERVSHRAVHEAEGGGGGCHPLAHGRLRRCCPGRLFAISEAYDKYPLAVKLHIADLQATYLMEHRTSNMR